MNVRVGMASALLVAGIALGWTIASAQQATKDSASAKPEKPSEEVPAARPLETLDWLVGEWEAKGDGRAIEFSCHFTRNNAFLLRSFRIVKDDATPLSGMQVIAWDPAREAIHSWTFDSNGGFGEDAWTQSGNTYTIRAKYTLPDGGRGSSINVMRYLDENSFAWRSVSREIDGELLPDIDEIVIERRSRSEGATESSAESKPAPAKKEEK